LLKINVPIGRCGGVPILGIITSAHWHTTTLAHSTMNLTANLIDIFNRTIYFASVTVENERIGNITRLADERIGEPYLLPGFIDSHVHIESSMLTPTQFARLAVVHGTVGTVSDPHEIGNVLGIDGVRYMIEDARNVPFKFCFGAPSCVPATTFETSGATITSDDVRDLLAMPEIGYLAEVMNFPAVLNDDADMLLKIQLAKDCNKPIDGHAPGLRGKPAQKYIEAGISTDHECFDYDEALDKVQLGMNIIIREGSAAKNFEALQPLISQFPSKVMFCSDDKHPDNLVEGHINQLVKRALTKGHSLFDVLQIACLNPVLHYNLKVGLLRKGDTADFILVDNLSEFTVQQTYIDGQLVAKNGSSLIPNIKSKIVNQFDCLPRIAADFEVNTKLDFATIRVIEALDGQLITNELPMTARIENDKIVADISRDILKIAVVNRYSDAPVAVGFVKNFGLKSGAIASSVAHDSHNIIAVGCDDESLCQAVNLVIEAKGGVSAYNSQPISDISHLLALPIAGLMSDEDGYEVAAQYTAIDCFAKELGSTLNSPFMTLSFMGLLVIPALKMSDLGLFDGSTFQFTDVVVK
jgi:adenine deaminase